MADSIDPKKNNKDAQSGEPVQLDKESQGTPPRPAQERPEQSPEQQGRPPQGGPQHGGGRKQ